MMQTTLFGVEPVARSPDSETRRRADDGPRRIVIAIVDATKDALGRQMFLAIGDFRGDHRDGVRMMCMRLELYEEEVRLRGQVTTRPATEDECDGYRRSGAGSSERLMDNLVRAFSECTWEPIAEDPQRCFAGLEDD